MVKALLLLAATLLANGNEVDDISLLQYQHVVKKAKDSEQDKESEQGEDSQQWWRMFPVRIIQCCSGKPSISRVISIHNRGRASLLQDQEVVTKAKDSEQDNESE